MLRPTGTRGSKFWVALALGRSHLLGLLAVMEAMRETPARAFCRDFTIWPA